MTWVGTIVLLLLGLAVLALAFGGAEPPIDIRTFSRASPEEQAFDRRAARLQALGYASVALAVLVGLIGAFEFLS
jgi:hypothetical protein